MFAPDLEAVLARGRETGLTHLLCILAAGDAAEQAQADRVAAQFPGARFAVGVHPHQAHESAQDGNAAALVRAACAGNPLVRAVGEIGLDFHYDFSPRDVQRAVFAEQVALARELDLPVIIHTREAEDDTFDILRSEGRGDVRGVFHCFTGDVGWPAARSISGSCCRSPASSPFQRPRASARPPPIVPDDRLLAETDSPFLAPVPHRGKRNEPALVRHVIETLAVVRASTVRGD